LNCPQPKSSDWQPELLSQALVEWGRGDETAQETDLARHFSRRIVAKLMRLSWLLPDVRDIDNISNSIRFQEVVHERGRTTDKPRARVSDACLDQTCAAGR